MDIDTIKIGKALMAMRRDAQLLFASPSESGYVLLKEKYNTVFSGEKFNVIYGDEFLQCLQTKWRMDIDLESLNEALPGVCQSIGAKCTPIQKTLNPGTTKQQTLKTYAIELYGEHEPLTALSRPSGF